MSILQSGVPKCGNFWLYQITQHILKKEGRNTTSFIEQQPIYASAREWELNFPDQARIDVLEITDLQYSYRISSVFRMPIEDIKSYIAQSPHVWTHSPICKRSPELFPLFDKIIHIVRDPRDRAISAAKYYCSDYMLKYFPQEEKDPEKFLQKNFGRLIQEWVWHVFDYIRLSEEYNIHIVLYEGLIYDFKQEVNKLLQYLEIELGEEDKLQLEKEMHFASLQKRNQKHLQRGESGYWRESLTDEQIEKAEHIAGSLMRYLNYPSGKASPMTYATELPRVDFEQLKKTLIDSQYG